MVRKIRMTEITTRRCAQIPWPSSQAVQNIALNILTFLTNLVFWVNEALLFKLAIAMVAVFVVELGHVDGGGPALQLLTDGLKVPSDAPVLLDKGGRLVGTPALRP